MTAEAAVVLPALVLFAMGLVWALLAAAAQIQCVDAARAGARAAARQDPDGVAAAAARQAAPAGARVTVRREGDLVRVQVVADSPGPAALALHLRHEAVALAEETVGMPNRAADATESASGAPAIGMTQETAPEEDGRTVGTRSAGGAVKEVAAVAAADGLGQAVGVAGHAGAGSVAGRTRSRPSVLRSTGTKPS